MFRPSFATGRYLLESADGPHFLRSFRTLIQKRRPDGLRGGVETFPKRELFAI